MTKHNDGLLVTGVIYNCVDIDVMGQRFCIYIYIYSAIFNCLGVYFIVCSGTGPWARVRSFRLLRGPTVSRAFGEFE